MHASFLFVFYPKHLGPYMIWSMLSLLLLMSVGTGACILLQLLERIFSDSLVSQEITGGVSLSCGVASLLEHAACRGLVLCHHHHHHHHHC